MEKRKQSGAQHQRTPIAKPLSQAAEHESPEKDLLNERSQKDDQEETHEEHPVGGVLLEEVLNRLGGWREIEEISGPERNDQGQEQNRQKREIPFQTEKEILGEGIR